MHDQQITYMSSNQRRTNTVRSAFYVVSQSQSQTTSNRVRIYRLPFFVVTVMTSEVTDVCHGSAISSADFLRKAEETKPRPQKLANIIDRLTPA